MSSPTPQSPSRQKGLMTHESPVHAKAVHSSHSYQNGLLEDARLAVLQDLGTSIPEIPLQTFIDFLTPPKPQFDICTTINALKSESILSASGRWTAFDKEPKDQLGHENDVFKPMTNIFTKAVDAIIKHSDLTDSCCSIDFLQNPNSAPKSAERHNATKPDGYLLVKDRLELGVVSWADVVLSCEYKKEGGNEQLDDNVRKCLWSMQHVMRDDPRRRATFGMTIENSTTRLWFCCRSSIIVSKAFDFIAEPWAFIEVFAMFAFADRKSLGFDPTIERAPRDKSHFIITVHPNDNKANPKMYRTTKILSSYGAEPLRGRGTRVFEAVEMDANGADKGLAVVLKDIWIDHDRTREGDILAQLHAQASTEDKKLVAKYFLTTICHGDVWTEPELLDDTENALMRGLKIPTDDRFQLQRKQLVLEKREAGTGSESLRATSRLHAPHPDRKYSHKTHYRIVFEEKGTTVDLIPTLPDVMTTLSETATALQLLRKLGWVHRDVSIGNILFCDGGAKLADLEYAKRVGDTKCHDLRTGTLHFMSIEVDAQLFLFRPIVGQDFAERMQRAKLQNEPATVPFSHNHLHDLESLWWVTVWMVFYHHFSTTPQSDDKPPFSLSEAASQLALARTLFPPALQSALRQNGLRVPLRDTCLTLPSNKSVIRTYLDVLRLSLITHFQAIESTLPQFIDLTRSEDDIFDEFRTVFLMVKEEFSDVILTFIPDIHARLRVNLKRARAESTNETVGATQKKK